jgi:AraC family transcriptional regulator, activator of mtrCDE
MQPRTNLTPTVLDTLLSGLEVDFVRLIECLISPGWRLAIAGASDVPGIHYCLAGTGRLLIGDDPPIPFTPHSLAIVPSGRPFKIEARVDDSPGSLLGTVESRSYQVAPGDVRRYVAGQPPPEIVMICGYFRATYGTSIDLFATLPVPIIETFNAADQLDHKLKSAMDELVAQEVGSGAMSAALLKQVLITLLRRSLASADRWAQRFVALGDPKIARAFSDMVARPGAPHTVQTLADTAGLSRSSFMARFTAAFGDSPMTVLRQLRMRRAQSLLAAGNLNTDQVAAAVGYNSRSSFHRAFKKAYGKDLRTETESS